MENINVLKATALAYLVPLAFLLIGTATSYFVLYSLTGIEEIIIELISGSIGVFLMLVAYILLKKNDKKFHESRKFIPIITRVL